MENQNTEIIKSVIEDITKRYLIPENGIIASIGEISKRTKISPVQIISMLGKNNIRLNDKSVGIEQDLKKLKKPKPSKKQDSIMATIQNEGQRYQRREQFPTSAKGRTTKQKADAKVVNYQIRKANITLTEALPIEIKRNIKKESRFMFRYQKSDNKKLEIDQRTDKNIDCSIPGVAIVKPKFADYYANKTRDFMRKTKYWSAKEMRQQVTPDLICFDPKLVNQVEEIISLETNYLTKIAKEYINDVKTKGTTPLTTFLEGSLEGSKDMQIFRKWAMATNENQPINYFRPDLGITTTEDGETKLVYIETNIMTAGTAPAVLWKNSRQNEISDMKVNSIAQGSEVFFVEQMLEKGCGENTFAIIANTPNDKRLQLYENGSKDLAKAISSYGINAGYARLTDLEIKNGNLFLPDTNNPIGMIFWRIRQFPTSELESPQGQLLLSLYAEGKVSIYPNPCISLFNNKNLEALIWSPNFQEYVPQELKKYTPYTENIDSRSSLFQGIKDGTINYQKYTLKKSLGSGGKGVLIGKQENRDTFIREMMMRAKNDFGGNVIQEFIEPTPVPLRIRRPSGGWTEKQFYLRVEPTVGIGQKGLPVITDFMVTGRYDTLLVGGGNTSIMTTVYKR